MNPEKPSRDEIEAKITALLLGELPDEEARLLRYTISQDAELTKLHDRLKATIGLVRHVSARPTETAPLKLSDDRRKKLLAHFQTPRPQETFWIRHMKLTPRFVAVAALIVITALLAAMLLPALKLSKSRSMTMSLRGEYGVTEDRLEPASPAEAEKKAEPPVLVTVAPVSQFSPPPSSAPPAPAPPPQSVAIYLPQTGAASQAQAPVQSGFQNAAGNLNAQNAAVNANGAANYGIAGSQQQVQSGTALQQRIVSNGVQTTPAAGAESTSESEAVPSAATVARDGGVYSPSTVGYVNAKLPADEKLQTIQPETDNLAVTTSPSTAPVASAGTGSTSGGAGFDRFGRFYGGFGSGRGGFAGSGSGGGGAGGNVHYRENVEQPKLPDTARQPYASFDGSTGSPTVYSPGHSAIVVTADNAAVPEGEFPVAPSGYVTTKDGRKVPVVGDMPLVGRLFSNNDNSVPAQPASGTTFAQRIYNQNLPAAAPAPAAIEANTGLPVGVAGGDLSDTSTRNRSSGTPSNTPIGGRYTYGLYSYQEDTNSLAQDNLDKEIKSLNDVAISDEAKDDHFVSRYAYTVSGVTNYFAADLHQKAGNASTQLYTKVLDVSDPEAIMSMAASVHSETSATNSSGLNYVTQLTLGSQVSGAARLYFKSQGVDLGAPGKGVFYNDRTGKLVVKGTADDLAVVERTFQSKGLENTTTMSLDDAIALYSKLTGRTILRSMIPLSVPVLVSNSPSGSDKDRELALQQALATANISLVNVGDNFVRVIPANGTGSATQASNNTEDLPLRQPAPNAPIPQPEVRTTDNAFSTFAMNVSDVSYKLAAASLEKGILPDASTIRSEEFINAFDYRDPEASAGQPVAFNSERAQDPFEQNRDFLRFSIKTAAAGRQPGRPLNIVLLLDNSGSMERADRVEIIRESLRVLASQLEAGDTVSVVTFARTARLWLDGVPGNQAGDALKKVSDLTPQGGTNLEEAMRLAYETARRHYLANGMNRVVLLTDGAANLGNVDARILTQKVEDNRRQGIALDCFGIGWEDYNDDLLEQLTSHGDGRYAFLNSPADASSEFAAKLAGALQIAAEEVKVQVEFNPDRVIAYRQIGYAKHQLTKEQFRDNSVAAGEIAAQEAGNALYTMELKPDGSGPLATVRLRYRVPGTQDYRERSWNVDYTGRAPALDKSGPAMRLAVTAAEFAEWLATSPYAQQVTLDQLQNDLRGVPQSYGADPRPKQLEWMIRQAHSLAGKGGQF